MGRIRNTQFERRGGFFTPRRVIIAAVVFVVLAAAAFFIYPAIANLFSESRVRAEESMVREGDLYYNSLSYRDQLLYDSIRTAALDYSGTSEVVRHSYDAEEFGRVVKFLRADMPQLYYVDFDSLILNHGRYRTNVTMQYLVDKANLAAMTSMLEEAVEEGVAAAGDSDDDFERELAVHDWLISRCDYSDGEKDLLHNTAYGALVQRSAYCCGYACALKLIYDRLGIDCAIVYGSVENGDHMWDLVRIGDGWYHLDAMWDDANISYGNDMPFHGYFDLSDADIRADHAFDYADILPDAGSGGDYYTVRSLRAATAAECADVFYAQLYAAASSEEKSEYVELFCEETAANEQLKPYYAEAVRRVNGKFDSQVLLETFQTFSASGASNALTIQIFYN